MKKKLTVFILVLNMSIISVAQERINGYEDFIISINASPMDYVFELFENHDIVILCERDHRDITQYELINKIINDPRFEIVSDVMCEVGSYNHTERVNSVINKHYQTEEEFYIAAMEFIKDMSYYSLWNKTNFIQLLSSVKDRNISNGINDRIVLTLLDIPYDWSKDAIRNHQAYTDFYKKNMRLRERIMADNFITAFEKSRKGKSLVILNSPHSFQGFPNKYLRETAAQYIFERYSGAVANVYINWVDLSSSDNDNKDRLIDGGLWDQAFARCGNKQIGFNLKGTPFGETLFNDMIKPIGNIKYSDVFTGFIYYNSPLEWRSATGFIYEFQPNFINEFVERQTIIRGRRRNNKYRKMYFRMTTNEVNFIYEKNNKIKKNLKTSAMNYPQYSSDKTSDEKVYVLNPAYYLKNDLKRSLIITKSDIYNTEPKYKNLKSDKFNAAGPSLYKSPQHYNTIKPSAESINLMEGYIESLKKEKGHIEFDMAGSMEVDDYTVECRKKEIDHRSICAGNYSSLTILPDGKVTICEELYWHPKFIIGDLREQTIMEVWNSPHAVDLFYLKQEEFTEESSCGSCDSFKDCRWNKGVCWKEILYAYGINKWDYPDPGCPLAPEPINEFYLV